MREFDFYEIVVAGGSGNAERLGVAGATGMVLGKVPVVRTERDIEVANSLISAIGDAHAGKYSGRGNYGGRGGGGASCADPDAVDRGLRMCG